MPMSCILNLAAIQSRDVLQVSLETGLILKAGLFDWLWLHKILNWETYGWKQSDRGGEEVEMIAVSIEVWKLNDSMDGS